MVGPHPLILPHTHSNIHEREKWISREDILCNLRIVLFVRMDILMFDKIIVIVFFSSCP